MFDIGAAILFLVPAAAIILLGPARLAHLGRLARRIVQKIQRRAARNLPDTQLRRDT
jgi:Sec-independent protein translocase protein TatA